MIDEQRRVAAKGQIRVSSYFWLIPLGAKEAVQMR